MSAVLATSPEEQAVSWALDHLQRAGRLRIAMERERRGGTEYGALHYQRHIAIEQAKAHVARLASVGYPLPNYLVASLRAEGLV